MKRKRFTEEQIISILREREAGMAVANLSRRHGVSEKVNHPDLVLACCSKPLVVGGVRIAPP